MPHVHALSDPTLSARFAISANATFAGSADRNERNQRSHLIWYSFQLYADLAPLAVLSIYESLVKRKGWTTEQTKTICEQVTEMTQSGVLHYDFDAVITVNPFHGHQLIHFANSYGVHSEMKKVPLSAYFTEEKNIGHRDILAALAQKAGVHFLRTQEVVAGKWIRG